MPIAVLVAMAGLWSGARASAFALLFAHKILARLGQTSLLAYSLGGAAASLAYALIAALFWAETTPFQLLWKRFRASAPAFSTGFLRRPNAAQSPLHTEAKRTHIGACPNHPGSRAAARLESPN